MDAVLGCDVESIEDDVRSGVPHVPVVTAEVGTRVLTEDEDGKHLCGGVPWGVCGEQA